MMGYSSLIIYYKYMFTLSFVHKYSLDEVNALIPYERDLYIDMIIDYIEEHKKK